MVSHLLYCQLALLALLWLFIMLYISWPRRSETPPPVPARPITPKCKRATELKAVAGLTHKPPCALCEREAGETPPAPPPRPDPMPPTHRRPRTVDPSMPFCPHPECANPAMTSSIFRAFGEAELDRPTSTISCAGRGARATSSIPPELSFAPCPPSSWPLRTCVPWAGLPATAASKRLA